MQVPLFDPRRQHAPLEDAFVEAFCRVLRSGRYILGPEVEAFEAAFGEAVACPNVIGVSSGSDALLATLMALEIGPGDEVLVPAYSFFATVGCVLRVGATPRFVDIDPGSMNAEAEAFEKAITDATRAVIAVHLYGRPVDGLEALKQRAWVVEDCAQATAAKPLRGHVGCYSFFPTKNLGAFGDGGAAVTADDAIADRLRAVRKHGSYKKYVHEVVGGNFRLDALQAALLAVKVPHLVEYNAQRRALAEAYRQALSPLEANGRLRFQVPHPQHVYHQCVIRVQSRDAVRAALAERGVGTEVYYPLALNRQPVIEARFGPSSPCPEAEAASEESLALPCFPGLSAPEQSAVVAALQDVLG